MQPRTQIRPATDLRERAAAFALRREIRESNLTHQGYDHDVAADPELDGQTLCAWSQGHVVASVDTHWGRDGALPAERTAILGATETARRSPSQVVVLDDTVVHPSWANSNAAIELKHAAVLLAARGMVRFVFTSCEPIDLAVHRALGFVPNGSPTSSGGNGTMIPMMLDLIDVDHLKRVGSPFVPFAERLKSTIPDMEEDDDSLLDDEAEDRWREVRRLSQAAESANATFLGATQGSARAKLLETGSMYKPRHRQAVISEGERGRDLFLVLNGAVEVQRRGQVVALLGPGEVFGEVGFLLKAKRTATITAATDDVAVLRLSRDSLKTLMESDPSLAASLAIAIAQGLCFKLMDAASR